MNPLSITGAAIVTFALISYSIGIRSGHINRQITPRILVFISLGVVLDVTATIFIILGSKNSPFTIHRFIGYSALFLMLIELVNIWRVYNKSGIRAAVPKGLYLYSSYAYIWWVVAYFAGSLFAVS